MYHHPDQQYGSFGYGPSSYGNSENESGYRSPNREWTDRSGDEGRYWADRNRQQHSSGNRSQRHQPDNDYRHQNHDRQRQYNNDQLSRHMSATDGHGINMGFGLERYDRDYSQAVNSGYDSRSNIYGHLGHNNSGYDQTESRQQRYSSYHPSYAATNRNWSERAGDEVRSWFGDEEAEYRRRQDEYRARNTEHRQGDRPMSWTRDYKDDVDRDWARQHAEMLRRGRR